MSTSAIASKDATTDRVGPVDLKLEVITLPVSDVDRAKQFYESLGWRLDADFSDGDERASPSSPLRDPQARSTSESPARVHQDPPRACSWWSPTYRLRAPTC